MFVINSSLGETDCSDCRIFRTDRVLFAQNIQQPRVVSLPIRIAEMPDAVTAKVALKRIRYAIKTGKLYVDLTGLE